MQNNDQNFTDLPHSKKEALAETLCMMLALSMMQIEQASIKVLNKDEVAAKAELDTTLRILYETNNLGYSTTDIFSFLLENKFEFSFQPLDSKTEDSVTKTIKMLMKKGISFSN